MELIERQSILAALEKAIANTNPDYYKMDTREGYGDWMHSNGFNCAITHAIVTIEQSVKYDAVEVVRCKDCKYWGNPLNWDGHIVGGCDFVEMVTDADGYCYRAVRKEVQE